MLGKLFKYEFKNTVKIMLTLYAILLAVTALGMIVISTDSLGNSQNAFVNALLASLLILYVLSIIALFVVTYVYICTHFYKTMFSPQGYLTHTLPVSPLTTLNVKIVTALVWIVLSMVMCILSVSGLVAAAAGPEAIADVFGGLHALEYPVLDAQFYELFNMHFSQLIFAGIIGVIVSCLYSLLWIFVSCSIGQLFNQYKVVASIVTGVVLYFLMQIVSSVFTVMLAFQAIGAPGFDADAPTNNVQINMGGLIWPSLLYTFAIAIIYYIVCAVIVKKHLNLD